jgi:hypothetical protein
LALDNNTTHALIAAIFAVAMLGLTASEAYFVHLTDVSMLWVVFQNIGLGFGNAYYVGKVILSPQGESVETSAKPTTS